MITKTRKTISRQEAREAIRELPIENVLLVTNSELTPKQKEFAKQVALGNSGAESYRIAYSKNGKKKTHGDNASRLKADERIRAEIEAYRLANEAVKYRDAVTLRNLVLHSLTQVLIDPHTKAGQKIQAARVLGQVSEVAAFVERKEITHINGSDDIKTQIIDQLKGLMLNSGSTGDIVDIDADELLAELAGKTNDSEPETLANPSEKGQSLVDLATVEGYTRGSNPNFFDGHSNDSHTIPHEAAPPIDDLGDQSQSLPQGNPPLSVGNGDGEGGIKNGNE